MNAIKCCSPVSFERSCRQDSCKENKKPSNRQKIDKELLLAANIINMQTSVIKQLNNEVKSLQREIPLKENLAEKKNRKLYLEA